MNKSKNITLLVRCLLIIICFNPGAISGQVELYSGGTGDSFNPFGTHVGDYMRVYEISHVRRLTGTPYLNEEWQNADIVFLKDDLFVKDIQVKIDVRNNWLEVNLKGKVYVLDADDTYSLFFKENNITFITRNALNKIGPQGFFEVIYNEESSLFCHYSASIKQANYIPALDAGEEDDKIIINTTYYAYINMQLIELEKKSKKFAKQFNLNEEMNTFFRHNRINPKNEQDLIKFLKYYDSINTMEF